MSSSHAVGLVSPVDSSGMTSDAPAESVPKISKTDRSKLSDESASTRSFEESLIRSLISISVLIAPWWSIITPFGVPVDPEV